MLLMTMHAKRELTSLKVGTSSEMEPFKLQKHSPLEPEAKVKNFPFAKVLVS